MANHGEVINLGPDEHMVVLLTSGQAVIRDILEERERQDEKWGPVPRLDHGFGKWLQILMEEIGEACKTDLDATGYPEIYSQADVDTELTQAAAVLVAWLEHRAAIRESMVNGQEEGT